MVALQTALHASLQTITRTYTRLHTLTRAYARVHTLTHPMFKVLYACTLMQTTVRVMFLRSLIASVSCFLRLRCSPPALGACRRSWNIWNFPSKPTTAVQLLRFPPDQHSGQYSIELVPVLAWYETAGKMHRQGVFHRQGPGL